MTDKNGDDDAPLGLGNLFRLARLVVDDARVDGTDYSRVLTDTLESLAVELKSAVGAYGPDRVETEPRIVLDVPDGTGREARLLVDGEDLLRRLPVRRARFDLAYGKATLRLDLARTSVKIEGDAAVKVQSELRDAAAALMLDWDELEDGEHAGDEHAVVEVPIELMRKLKEEIDR